MTLTGGQIRDARFRRGLKLEDFAARSGMDWDRLAHVEAIDGAPAWAAAKFDCMRSALDADVEFIPENGDRAGIRLRKAEQKDGGP